MTRREHIKQSIKSLSEFDDTPEGIQRRWLAEMHASQQALKKFHKQADGAWKAYLDEDRTADDGLSYVNLFNTNVGILQNSLYARLPKPDVERRYQDPNDQIARVASLSLERAVTTDSERDRLQGTHKYAILDYLVAGLGVTWQRYEADTVIDTQIQSGIDEHGNIVTDETEVERIVAEYTPTDYVHYRDFLWDVKQSWKDTTWVARRVRMHYDDLKERFPDQAENIRFAEDEESETYQLLKEADVWEIWDKRDKKVYWICKDAPQPLDTKDDLYKLPEFFPCAEPMMANTGTRKLIPKPDYVMVQDQYVELNRLNNRISRLTESIKAAGVYNPAIPEIGQLLDEGIDGEMLRATSWEQSGLAEKGLEGNAVFLPIREYSDVLTVLIQNRSAVINQIYELTGINDIVRGMAQPYVTAQAEQMKGAAVSMRLVMKQQAISEHVSEGFRLKAWLMCDLYSDEHFKMLAGQLYEEDMQYAEPALQLLKTLGAREFRIHVRADSMAIADQTADQKGKIEFLTSLGQFFSQVGPVAEKSPEAALTMIEAMRMAASSFKSAQAFEGVLEKQSRLIEKQIQEKAANPQPPKPSEAEVRLQMEQARQQHEMQMDQAKAQREQQDSQNKIATDAQKASHEAQIEQIKADAAQRMKEMELDIERQKLDLERTKLAIEARKVGLQEQAMVLDVKLKARQALGTPAEMTQPGNLSDYLDPESLSDHVQGVMAEEYERHVTPEFVQNLMHQMQATMLANSEAAVQRLNETNAHFVHAVTNALNTAVNTPPAPQTFTIEKDDDGKITGRVH